MEDKNGKNYQEKILDVGEMLILVLENIEITSSYRKRKILLVIIKVTMQKFKQKNIKLIIK